MQNNPLSYTDPSGYFLSGLFKKIGRVLSNIARGFMGLAKTIARSSIARAILTIVACATTGPVGCAATSAGLTLAAGGSIRDAFIAGALAFVQVPGGAGAGGIWGMVGDAVKISGTGFLGTVVTHAVVSGAISMAQGGSFLTGAISGAVGAVGSGLGATFGVDPISRIAISAVAGGTASVLAGGKFANGAITSAFATMFNDMKDHTGVRGAPGTQSGGAATNRESNLYDDITGAGVPIMAKTVAFAAAIEGVGVAYSWASEAFAVEAAAAASVFAVDSAGTATLFVRSSTGMLEVTPHAAQRMTQWGLSIGGLETAVGQTSFRCFHAGLWKTGYYDPATRVFVGSVAGRITTITGRASTNYIKNLQSVRP